MNKEFKIQITGMIDENKTIKKLNKQIAKLENQVKEMKLKLDTKQVKTSSNSFNTLNKALKSVDLNTTQLNKNFKQQGIVLKDGEKTIKSYVGKNNEQLKVTERLVGKSKEYTVELKKLNTEFTKNGKTMTELKAQYSSYAGVQSKLGVNLSDGWTKLNSEMDSNGNVSEKWTNNAGKIVTLQGQIIDGQTKWVGKTKEVNQAVDTNAKQADKWKYSWSKAFQSFTTYMSVTTVFYQTVAAIKSMIDEVVELDGALVELQKVTDLEGESLDKFTKKAYDAAETVAKTGTEMINAATEFAKSGYDENQALELGRLALMYTNIADEEVSAGEAAEFMVAQMKAFNLEASDAEHIIDAVNEVANRFAVSSADISENLGNASSVMSNAGNSMEEVIGLLTAGTEITRSASKVSNGLKTITLRLQGMNDEGEEDLELMAKMEELYNKFEVSVYDANEELKNTFELLETLAPIYKEATAEEKAYITETIAGKYQAQNAAAILSNFETAIKATEAAMDSSGSAMAENEKVMDSIEGKVKSLQSAWEEFSQKILSSDFLKMIVDIGNAFMDIANSGIGQFIIKGAMLVITLTGIVRGFDFISKKIAIFSASMQVASLQMKGATVEATLLEAANKRLSISFTNIGKAAKAAWALISAHPLAAIATAIAAIGVAILLTMESSTEKAKRLAEEAKEAAEEVTKLKDELEKVVDELETTKKRIEELEGKDKLSFVERDELNNLKIQNNLLEIQNKNLEDNVKLKEEEAKIKANEAFWANFNKPIWGEKTSIPNNKNSSDNNTNKGFNFNNNDRLNLQGGYIEYDSPEPTREKYESQEEYINGIIDAYNRLNEAILNNKATEEEIAKKSDYENLLTGWLKEYNEYMSTLSGDALIKATEMRDAILKVLNPEQFKAVKLGEFLLQGYGKDDDDLTETEKNIKNLRKTLYDYAEEGEISAEKIKELTENNEDFKNLLEELEIPLEDVYYYLNKITSGEGENSSSVKTLIEKYEQLSDITDSLVSSLNSVNDALLEQAENGRISIETALGLIDNGYAAALAFNEETGAITINRDAMIALAKAKLLLQKNNLQNNLDKSINKYNEESQAVALNTDALIENLKARVASGEEMTDLEQSILDQYAEIKAIDKVRNQIGNLGTISWSYSISKPSSSSSSSSNAKEWWEEEFDKLKDQFKYNEITIDEYINSLGNLLGRVSEGTDAWRQINEELQKQRLTKVEDDYKRGIISIDEYIKKLKELIKAYKEGTDAWNDLADSIKEALTDKLEQQQEDYETAADAAIGIIDEEIEKLEELRDAEEERYDKLIEEKEKANEETEKEIELARLQEALENAKKEKTKRVECMLSIKMAQNGETPEEDNTVGKICFEISYQENIEEKLENIFQNKIP